MDPVFRWICIWGFLRSDPDKYADLFFCLGQDPVLVDPDSVLVEYESNSLRILTGIWWIQIQFFCGSLAFFSFHGSAPDPVDPHVFLGSGISQKRDKHIQ